MLKRLRWMVIGAVLAGVLYVWLSGRVRNSSAERVAYEAARTSRELGERLRSAWREGREEMSRKQDELRREFLDR